MAVTGFWPIYKNLKATLDYADNPDKTTDRRYLDDDLYVALSYAENDNKTDRKMYVGGINCSKQNAYSEMIAVQRRFGLRGKVVGYHGIQSFREGEVTPEQAFEIGKATARKMWGDRYQVLVTVHLNTDNVHCHFVVNPVSFKDGTKFQNKIGDHKELRKVSDAICQEHGLSVLENSSFYGGHKKDYWRHKSGKKTHRDYLREDVEYCLSFATSPREFESQLYALGYTLDPVRFSVKAKHWERSVRLANIGFTKEIVQAQLDRNAECRYHLFTLEYRPPYRPKKFPLEDELRKLEFSIDHSYDAATVLVDTIFYLVITVIQIAAELSDVMLLVWREKWADVTNKYLAQYPWIDARIDHRSHAARGLDEQPTIHEGVTARALEKKGIISDRCELNRQIKADNALLRELKSAVRKLMEAVKNTIPAVAEAMEKLRENMIIFRYQLNHIAKGKRSMRKYIKSVSPELERYTGLVQQLKDKTKERKNLLAEKKETPFYQLPKLHDLSRRIAELTEELEELKSEKAALLNTLDCADDASISEVKKQIVTMETALKKLEEQESKYAAELEDALKQYADLKAQAADVDAVELMDARLDIRPDRERSSAERVKAAYGEKYDPLMMYDSKRDVADLLNEEAEARSVRDFLRQKQKAQQTQQQRKPKRHEQER